MTLSRKRIRLAEALLRWYDATRRDLPFRRTTDPYAIWVSEVMLQQTQVSTVIPYFERWMQRFPTVHALARADEQDVLHAFQGLGYYSRARCMLRAAREVVDRFAGELPRSAAGLEELPGLGPYSANAIASIAFGEQVPVVDGNVKRVLCRVFEMFGDPDKTPLKAELWAQALGLVPKARPGDFNQALMELGATLCTPRSPRCQQCPLRRLCRARQSGTAEALPQLPLRPKVTHVRMAAALVLDERGRVATVQLGASAARSAGMWQFPSVELETGEASQDAARRAARETLRLEVHVDQELTIVQHSVTRFRIALSAYRCRALGPIPRKAGPVAWRKPSELHAIPMPAAHRRLSRLLTPAPETPSKVHGKLQRKLATKGIS